jgi:hypothetical protein
MKDVNIYPYQSICSDLLSKPETAIKTANFNFNIQNYLFGFG